MEKKCFIFGSGEYDDIAPDFSGAGYIIAADGGYSWLKAQSVKPDLLVGDFDSLGSVPQGIETVRHPVMKDDTDMALAVQEGIERGFTEFIIYGGLGGRLDHTLANIQLIAGLARRGMSAFLVSEDVTVTVIHNAGLKFPAGYSGIFSSFAFGGTACGVLEDGFLYPLKDAEMYDDRAMGVSNEFLGGEACVEVKNGTLAVMWQGNIDKALPELYILPGGTIR